jgi:hypothetical protein
LRQATFKWQFSVIMVLLLSIPGGIPTQNVNGSAFARFGLPDTKAIIFDKVRELFACTTPTAANMGDIAFRANLVPSPNNGLINPRQIPPVWERILAVKQMGVMLGFFFATMVISLFFIFYRNSRNGSGDDSLSDISYRL